MRVGLQSSLLWTMLLSGLLACASDPEPRAQLIVEIDTDAPVVGQLAADDALSADVAVDSLRIDVIPDDRSVIDFRDLTVPDVKDWPVTLGVAAESGGPPLVRLRMRAFRAKNALRGGLDGKTTLEPEYGWSIDRVVELPLPTSGIRRVGVILSTACFSAPASFSASKLETCVDADRRAEPPTEGVEGVRGVTLAGTSQLAREERCTSASPEGAVCIPGGTTTLGDREHVATTRGIRPLPRHAVHLRPFHLDRFEFTVGRYRALLNAGRVTQVPASNREECTWAGRNDATADAMPLNCVDIPFAAAACAAVGGRLPSEAQWEHAARGRGRGYRYPWGDEPPSCCSASLDRALSFRMCGAGIEPAGSHVAGCSAVDVSRDGVVDLAGGLTELTRDGSTAYDDACWPGPGLMTDAECSGQVGTSIIVGRGGNWTTGILLATAAVRHLVAANDITLGFRCAYSE